MQPSPATHTCESRTSRGAAVRSQTAGAVPASGDWVLLGPRLPVSPSPQPRTERRGQLVCSAGLPIASPLLGFPC